MTITRLLAVSAACILLAACQTNETRRLHTWLDAEFETELDFSPLTRTRLGDKRAYDQLDDVSDAARERRLQWRRDSVARMKTRFDYDALDAEGRISWELWAYRLEDEERNRAFRHHRYIFGRYGPQSRLPNSLINTHRVDSAEDMRAYIARLEASSRYLGQYLALAQQAAAEGIRAPYFDYDRALSEIARVTSGAPFSATGTSAIWADAQGKVARLRETGAISGTEAEELEAATRDALLRHFKPGYDEVAAWLRSDRANVAEVARGASSLPNGQAFYATRLRSNTTLPITAAEVHELGLAEVARIQAEMDAIRQQVGFEGDLRAFFTFLREDDRFFLPNTDAGRAEYLALADGYVQAMYTKLPDYFGILPQAPMVVRRVEAYRESAGSAAHYRAATRDGSRPGTFYVHLADMRAVAVNRLENLSYHEGVPGHHMQIAIQRELSGIPRFRTVTGYTAYSEGWGLYAELLAKEMGGYPDPYSDMGRLGGEIWRAVRLVVDTGIHHYGWSEERAVNYALDNSSRPETSVRAEIHRYFNNPAQATAYKIGMIQILEIRQRAKEALGDDFDIRGFHDTVLGSGPLPLPLLEAKVQRWVARQTGET